MLHPKLTSVLTILVTLFLVVSAIASPKVVEGEFYIKVKDASKLQTQKMLANVDGVQFQQATPELKPVFTTNDSELSRIYKVQLGNVSDAFLAADQIAQDENVEYAEPVYMYEIEATPNDQGWSVMADQFKAVKAPEAWDVVKGEAGSVVIAVIDGGTEWRHSDLIGNVWTNPNEVAGNGIDDDNNGYVDDVHGWNFANNTADPTGLSSTPKNAAHGTHVAGIASCVTNNGTGVPSLAWNAKIMPINASYKVDNNIAYGYKGIQYAVDNGADIISVSWARSGIFSQTEQDIINYAASRGVLVVAAAGNAGTDTGSTPYYPAAYANVLSVGSTNAKTDKVSSFSNYGSNVDVYAPGESVISTVTGNSYQRKSGTSMAAPFVASLAALVKTQFPTMNVDEITNQIQNSADDITSANSSYAGALGYGRINAYEAVGGSTENSTLPVEFSSFEATMENGQAVLNWQTATETNNFGFEVQKNVNGEWVVLGFVNGNGTTVNENYYSFVDADAANEVVEYRLKQIDTDGTFDFSNTVTLSVTVPMTATLEQNYPNPFNMHTTIEYSVTDLTNVELTIFDNLGRTVTTLVNETQNAGNYTTHWNGSDDSGFQVASGTYFAVLTAGETTMTKTLSLIK